MDCNFYIDVGMTTLGDPPDGERLGRLEITKYVFVFVASACFKTDSLFPTVYISMYFSMSMLHINPEWNRLISDEIEARLGGDIMLIIIYDGQKVDGVWQTVDLPPAKDNNTACCEEYQELTTLGYGASGDGEPDTGRLKRITLNYQPAWGPTDKWCSFASPLTHHMFCAKDLGDGREDVCDGDEV